MSDAAPAGFERRLLLMAALAPLPAVLIALGLLVAGSDRPAWRVIVGALIVLPWLWGAVALRRRVAHALRTISNLLGALRERDFSVRGRYVDRRDALGDVMAEINGLANMLGEERAGAFEAGALLSKVIAEIDVVVMAFDGDRNLRLVNLAGERLLGAPKADLVGVPATSLHLLDVLEGEVPRTIEASFASGQGLWELRRSSFRLGGRAHDLVVLTDLRRALREEERQTWQRLVRVIGHELNNSLAPIASIASDLQQTLDTRAEERPADWSDDLRRGLAVIARRAEALGRFMSSSTQLAKVPPPRLGSVDVSAWLRRVADLERRLEVAVAGDAPLTIRGDTDQLDQLLINLVRNAVDAALETGGGVEVRWRKLPREVEILVADEGPGVGDTRNLFVPFFTTKPAGSGIGLVLSRQIAEAHRGTLTLETRVGARGAVARLRLPLA